MDILVFLLLFGTLYIAVVVKLLRDIRRGAKRPRKPRVCPGCGVRLGPGDPDGLCPDCRARLRQTSPIAAAPARREARTGPYVPGPPQLDAGELRELGDAGDPGELARHFPHLEVAEQLGRGGMGVVYKARQPKLDRFVALKILPPEAGREPHFAERFSREAKALAKLSHPHIVAVHDFGEADGLFYFLMEYVDGSNLRQLIRTRPVRPEEALRIIGQACDALQYAHEEGVIHRDIKPENILIDKRGRVKLADFGLAKVLGRATTAHTLTGSQQVMGTPHYMAPEQWEKPHAVDHRADIYSLGVVLYELLTGELPLGRFAAPSQKASVDSRLDGVVLRALEKEPEQRYQRVSELRAALLDSNETQPARAVPPAEKSPLSKGHRTAVFATEASSDSVGLPFSIDAFGKLVEPDGLLRLEGDSLVIEYKVLEEAPGGLRRRLRELVVPFHEIELVRFPQGWFKSVLVIRTPRMRAVADFPGASSGQVELWIARKDLIAARVIQQLLSRRLPAERVQLQWAKRRRPWPGGAVGLCTLGIAAGFLPWVWPPVKEVLIVGGHEITRGVWLNGFETWHGLAVIAVFAVLLVGVGVSFWAKRWPRFVRLERIVSAIAGPAQVLIALAALCVALFLLLLLFLAERRDVHMGPVAALVAPLVALPWTRRLPWTPKLLFLAGWMVVVLSGLFLLFVLSGADVSDYTVEKSPDAVRSRGHIRFEWSHEGALLGPGPLVTLAVGVGLLVAAWLQFRRTRVDRYRAAGEPRSDLETIATPPVDSLAAPTAEFQAPEESAHATFSRIQEAPPAQRNRSWTRLALAAVIVGIILLVASVLAVMIGL